MEGLKAGGKELVKLTKQELTKKVKGATIGGNKRWKKPMVEGVKQINDKDYCTVVVSIMRDARLRWEETGTDDRYTTKKSEKSPEGMYRGKIEPKDFFKDARQSPSIAKEVEDALIKQLDKALKK